jgi:hypothetical protein
MPLGTRGAKGKGPRQQKAAHKVKQGLSGSGCLFHVPLLSGDDKSETLPYQITPFEPIGAEVGKTRGGL